MPLLAEGPRECRRDEIPQVSEEASPARREDKKVLFLQDAWEIENIYHSRIMSVSIHLAFDCGPARVWGV